MTFDLWCELPWLIFNPNDLDGNLNRTSFNLRRYLWGKCINRLAMKQLKAGWICARWSSKIQMDYFIVFKDFCLVPFMTNSMADQIRTYINVPAVYWDQLWTIRWNIFKVSLLRKWTRLILLLCIHLLQQLLGWKLSSVVFCNLSQA